MTLDDESKLVAAARFYKAALTLAGAVSLDLNDGSVTVSNPGADGVAEFRARPLPSPDMVRRGFLLYEMGQVVAEAEIKKAPPGTAAVARQFAMAIPTMNEVEVIEAVDYIKNCESRRATKH